MKFLTAAELFDEEFGLRNKVVIELDIEYVYLFQNPIIWWRKALPQILTPTIPFIVVLCFTPLAITQA